MAEVLKIGNGWHVTQATFSPAEMEAVTKLPQPLLRLWRSRGYLAQKNKGQRSRHSASDIAIAYLLHALSQLGVPPSVAAGKSVAMANDLLFFALVAGDGACEFVGPRGEIENLQHRFEDDFGLARKIANPTNEDRFIVSQGGAEVWRCADLCRLIEEERLEYHFCVDLLVAGKSILERARRPLFSCALDDDSDAGPRIRRLSHGK